MCFCKVLKVKTKPVIKLRHIKLRLHHKISSVTSILANTLFPDTLRNLWTSFCVNDNVRFKFNNFSYSTFEDSVVLISFAAFFILSSEKKGANLCIGRFIARKEAGMSTTRIVLSFPSQVLIIISSDH